MCSSSFNFIVQFGLRPTSNDDNRSIQSVPGPFFARNKYLQDVRGSGVSWREEKRLMRSYCHDIAKPERRLPAGPADGGAGERNDDGGCWRWGNEQGELSAQMVLLTVRRGEENSTAERSWERSAGACPRNSKVWSPRRSPGSSTRRKFDSMSPRFSTEWRSMLPGLTRKAPFWVGGRTMVNGFPRFSS